MPCDGGCADFDGMGVFHKRQNKHHILLHCHWRATLLGGHSASRSQSRTKMATDAMPCPMVGLGTQQHRCSARADNRPLQCPSRSRPTCFCFRATKRPIRATEAAIKCWVTAPHLAPISVRYWVGAEAPSFCRNPRFRFQKRCVWFSDGSLVGSELAVLVEVSLDDTFVSNEGRLHQNQRHTKGLRESGQHQGRRRLERT